MSCISITYIRILFDGGKLDYFAPSRGIRQGIRSPLTYLYCAWSIQLFLLMRKQLNIIGQVSRLVGGVCYLLIFSLELILFSWLRPQMVIVNPLSVLNNFCVISCHKFSFLKSIVAFSKNVQTNNKIRLSNILDLKPVDRIFAGYVELKNQILQLYH